MKTSKLKVIMIIGLIAIVGILIAQLLWTKQAYGLEEKKFSQKVHVALLEVARKLYEGTDNEMIVKNPVEKQSNDYYIVNVSNDFEPDILEYYLTHAFEKADINTDFEYAMYDCQSDEMVYGDYISVEDGARKNNSVYFPKHQNLVYYFAVRFPKESSYLLNSLGFWYGTSAVLLLILLIYVYSLVALNQHTKYADLQRDFINNMTHEFKTPLSSILLASNYLSKNPVISNDDKLQKYSEIITDQGQKLNNHINEILKIAKNDATGMKMDIQPVSLAKIAKEAAENMRVKHPSARIDLDIEAEYIVMADAFHLSNVIYNLLDNSIKYCDEDPEIVLRIFEQNNKIVLEIQDNGIGIESGKQDAIFDRFYRILNTKSNEVSGFGLGLYYVKRICTLHRWKISAINNANKGATFRITIPITTIK